MASIEDAKAAFQRVIGRYKEKTNLRLAFTGDGRGTGRYNFYYEKNEDYIWVRIPSDMNAPFLVLNRDVAPEMVNLPVWLGRTEIEPEEEQVLAVNYNAVKKNDIPVPPDPVGGDGLPIYITFGSSEHIDGDWSEFFIGPGQPIPRIVDRLSDSKFAVVYYHFDTDDRLKAAIGTVSGTTVTMGTPQVIYPSYSDYFNCIGLAEDKVIFVYTDINGFGKAVIGTISGTSITLGGVADFGKDGSGQQFMTITKVIRMTSTKVLVIYDYNPSPGLFLIRTEVLDISGTTITPRSGTNITPDVSDPGGTAVRLNDNEFVFIYNDDNNNIVAVHGEDDGSSITIGPKNALFSPPQSQSHMNAFLAHDDIILLSYYIFDSPSTMVLATLEVSGSTVSVIENERTVTGYPQGWDVALSKYEDGVALMTGYSSGPFGANSAALAGFVYVDKDGNTGMSPRKTFSDSDQELYMQSSALLSDSTMVGVIFGQDGNGDVVARAKAGKIGTSLT